MLPSSFSESSIAGNDGSSANLTVNKGIIKKNRLIKNNKKEKKERKRNLKKEKIGNLKREREKKK